MSLKSLYSSRQIIQDMIALSLLCNYASRSHDNRIRQRSVSTLHILTKPSLSSNATVQYCNFPTDSQSILFARQRIMHCIVTASLPFLYDVWLESDAGTSFALSNPGKRAEQITWTAALKSGQILRRYLRDPAFEQAYV